MSNSFRNLSSFATALAFFVVVLGAFVRLSDAGLGCPDWPGCYGHIGVPTETADVAQANAVHPERHVEAPKAWKEMIHRYFAGTLGLLVLALSIMAWRNRADQEQAVKLPFFLLGLIIFQALLGMWTVTLLLKPVVVMGHLMGGMAMLSLLWLLTLRSGKWLHAPINDPARSMQSLAMFGLVILVCQIALGGWTSANYAALACYDLPTCQGQWWPPMNFSEGFVLWRGLGIDYEGGVLGNDARVAIHMTHRIGALMTAVVLFWVALKALRLTASKTVRRIAMAIKILLFTQICLGIANILLSLPLAVADAHNGFAALLLLSLVALNYSVRSK